MRHHTAFTTDCSSPCLVQACVRKIPRGVVTHLFRTASHRPAGSFGRMPAPNRATRSAVCSPSQLAKLDPSNTPNASRTASHGHSSWRWYAFPNLCPKPRHTAPRDLSDACLHQTGPSAAHFVALVGWQNWTPLTPQTLNGRLRTTAFPGGGRPTAVPGPGCGGLAAGTAVCQWRSHSDRARWKAVALML